MKPRYVAFVLLVLAVVCWLLLRAARDEAGTNVTEATKAQKKDEPKTAAPVAEISSAPEQPQPAVTNATPLPERTSTIEKISAPATAPETAATSPTNLPLPRFVGGHRANIPPGGALVMGGWRQPDGNCLLMFASPVPQPDGKTVKISSRFISIPPARLSGGGWDKFLTDENVSKEGGVFTAAEFAETIRRLDGFKDVDAMSSPTIVTLFGSQAQIQIGQQIAVPQLNGTPMLYNGFSQAIIARQIEGSDETDLAVTAAQFDGKP